MNPMRSTKGRWAWTDLEAELAERCGSKAERAIEAAERFVEELRWHGLLRDDHDEAPPSPAGGMSLGSESTTQAPLLKTGTEPSTQDQPASDDGLLSRLDLVRSIRRWLPPEAEHDVERLVDEHLTRGDVISALMRLADERATELAAETARSLDPGAPT